MSLSQDYVNSRSFFQGVSDVLSQSNPDAHPGLRRVPGRPTSKMGKGGGPPAPPGVSMPTMYPMTPQLSQLLGNPAPPAMPPVIAAAPQPAPQPVPQPVPQSGKGAQPILPGIQGAPERQPRMIPNGVWPAIQTLPLIPQQGPIVLDPEASGTVDTVPTFEDDDDYGQGDPGGRD